MSFQKIKTTLKQNWLFYFIAAALVIGMKYFYSKAGSNELEWILAPTSRWVSLLTGIPFENVPGAGYVNHQYRFIIAPSCSGVQFMLITTATLIFCYIHRMPSIRSAFRWTALSIAASYLLTIFVNGFRIALSIYLPQFLLNQTDGTGWLTPERLHTITGTTVYFTSLMVIYRLAGYVSGETALSRSAGDGGLLNIIRKCLPPMFCYFSVVLGIPILRMAYRDDPSGFAEYALVLLCVCGLILCVYAFALIAGRHCHGSKT